VWASQRLFYEDIDWALRPCVPRFLMLIAAFKSLHKLVWHTGQLCILWDSGFLTLWPQLEHSWLVPFGFTETTFKPAFSALLESISMNWPQPASLILFANLVLVSPFMFNFSTAITSYFLSRLFVVLKWKSLRVSATFLCWIPSFLIAFLRRLDPFFLRETRRCADFNLRSALRKNLGAAILSLAAFVNG